MAKATKKKATKKSTKKTVKKSGTRKRTRRTKPYPSIAFEDALVLGNAIDRFSGGQPIKRLTLMEKMERSPTSGSTRAMITDSGKYGVTSGSFNADTLSLTTDGKVVCSSSSNPRARTRSSFKLAIESIAPFKAMYDHYVKNRLPSKEVMRDFLNDHENLDVLEQDIQECIDIFIVNCKSVGVLRLIAGTETLVPIENVLDGLPAGQVEAKPANNGASSQPERLEDSLVSSGPTDWDKACFYITPIGSENSEERRHSDLFLSSLIRPAVEEIGLDIKRADEIDHAGMITGVVMEWLDKAKLVVADLSYLNPNVFYELALRHAQRKPIVYVIQKENKIPFDINQLGVIVIDNSDIYSLVPQLSSYISQIAAKARRAIDDPESVGNPLVSFYPGFWDSIRETQADAK